MYIKVDTFVSVRVIQLPFVLRYDCMFISECYTLLYLSINIFVNEPRECGGGKVILCHIRSEYETDQCRVFAVIVEFSFFSLSAYFRDDEHRNWK